ncbi:MAG: peptidylprolyl isomerase [Nitrospirae bacterium]|nr:peptidylprolyl isomerase [Nitrospirota bacterium]
MAWRALRVVGLLTAAFCASSPSEAAHMADRIVAIVNTEVITLSELKAQTEAEEKRAREQYRGAELERRLQQIQYMALTRMIERKLQVQFARAKGVDVSDEEIKNAVRELQRQGENIDDSNPNDKNSVKEQLMLLRVVDREVRSGVMVGDAELQRYFEQHQSRFMLPQEYRISQILIRPRAGEDRAEARARAAAVYAALKQGEDFADLALRRSDSPEATRGGSLGFVRQGELLAPIERALANLQPGQFSEPVETPEGLHIIRLEEKKPAQFRPFAEVKNEIQNLVYRQKSEDRYQLWMAELKNKSFIEVKF